MNNILSLLIYYTVPTSEDVHWHLRNKCSSLNWGTCKFRDGCDILAHTQKQLKLHFRSRTEHRSDLGETQFQSQEGNPVWRDGVERQGCTREGTRWSRKHWKATAIHNGASDTHSLWNFLWSYHLTHSQVWLDFCEKTEKGEVCTPAGERLCWEDTQGQVGTEWARQSKGGVRSTATVGKALDVHTPRNGSNR